MEEIFKYLGLFSTSTVVVYVIIRYLSQKLFENYLTKRIESYKSELERLNISHQIQFSSLHKERAEVIKNLYDFLYEYKLVIMAFFKNELDIQKPKEHLKYKLEEWTKAVLLFSTTFHKNKIFFSSKQVELINSINNKMNEINTQTGEFLSRFQNIGDQIEAIRNNNDEFSSLSKKSHELLSETQKLEKQLETEFRRLLGVEL